MSRHAKETPVKVGVCESQEGANFPRILEVEFDFFLSVYDLWLFLMKVAIDTSNGSSELKEEAIYDSIV